MSERETYEDWIARAAAELSGARHAWRGGNAGRGRVGSRRAAGMAIKGWLALATDEGYGSSFMHHLNALADDMRVEAVVREAAWRLAARPVPDDGWRTRPPDPLTPLADAERVLDWVRSLSERTR